MLVLSRKIDEQIVIGRDIDVTVLHISGNRVKLGITCDRSIPILRKEMVLPGKKFPGSDGCRPSDAHPRVNEIDSQTGLCSR